MLFVHFAKPMLYEGEGGEALGDYASLIFKINEALKKLNKPVCSVKRETF